MKNKIKFRGQNIKGIWNYGLLTHDKTKDSDYEWFISNSSGKPYAFGAIEKTIGQMWIINDNLEIFTDDLFTAICSPSGSGHKKERLCKVGFGGKGMSLSVRHKGEWWAYGYMDFPSIKIVGNIHDNPELLS